MTPSNQGPEPQAASLHEALLLTAARHRLLLAQIPATVWVVDRDLRIVSAEGADLARMGLHAADLLGMSLERLLGDAAGAEDYLDLHRRACAGESAHYETRWADRYLDIWLEPFVEADGAVTGCLGVALDVTDRHRAQEDLRVLERAVESSGSAIVICDARLPDTPITYANPAFERMTGYSLDEARGRNPRFLQNGDRDQAARAALRVAMQEGREGTATLLNHRKDGTPFWNEMVVSPVHDESGAVTHFVGVLSDVTERRLAEDDLHRALDRERHVVEALQRSLLMEPPEDAFPHLSVAMLYEAALDEASIGGDFFDALPLPNGHVALFVGDVSGKGLTAAAHTAEIKFTLRALLREHHDVGEALRQLNEYINETRSPEFDALSTEMGTYVTLSAALVEGDGHAAEVAVAGMEPPVRIRADGTVERLEISGMMLGVLPGTSYVSSTVGLEPGDTLLLLTDGITEARRGNDFFGIEGVMEAARQVAALPSLRQRGHAILEAARTFAGGALRDDVCLLLLRRR